MKRQKLNSICGGYSSKTLNEGMELTDIKSCLINSNVEAHLPSRAELEELDHIAVNLAYQVDQLVSKFQWLKSIDLDTIQNEFGSDLMRVAFFQSPRLRLASRLVQQYWNEGIPLFDYILAPRYNLAIPQIPDFQSANLSEERVNELRDLALASSSNPAETLQKRFKGDSAFLRNRVEVGEVTENLSDLSESRVRSHKPGTKPPKLREPLTWPPPLPQITDPRLYRQVFTHKSSITDASLKSTAEVLNTQNERLEFKGDSILDFFVCDLLFNQFPEDTEGDLSVKKASLVCNDTLFDISVAYKLHEHIVISSDLRNKIYSHPGDSRPDMKTKNKALADVFEAYIAGVDLSHGLQKCHDWLRELFAPMINNMSSDATTNPKQPNKNAKNDLYRQIGSVDQPIDYLAENSSPPFIVRCMVRGEVLGRGEGPTVKAAGLKAAENALRVPAIVEKFAAKRRNTPKMAPTTSH